MNVTRCDSCGAEHPSHLPLPHGWEMWIVDGGGWGHHCPKCGARTQVAPEDKPKRKRGARKVFKKPVDGGQGGLF